MNQAALEPETLLPDPISADAHRQYFDEARKNHTEDCVCVECERKRKKPSKHREGGLKAAETRRRNREAAAKPEPSVDTTYLRTLIQRVFEKREELAETQGTLALMESELDALIDRIAKR
jgi:hypothetical protein